jgi:PQQ-like domain
MLSHARSPLRSALTPVLTGAALLLAAGCSGTHAKAGTSESPAWSAANANAVSRPVTGSGFTAVTGLQPDGHLRTAVFDVTSGKQLWTRQTTMSGRPVGMGVEPPAIVGATANPEVADLEPAKAGTALVARDARTGRQLWARPVDSTFGPAACGDEICVSESTARKSARFAALDAATGKPVWHTPGIGEVEWSDATHVVLFRMAAHPAVESRDLKSGKTQWSFPVEKALGAGVNLSGGWAFGTLGNNLIGYMAPYQARQGGGLSPFGFFSLSLADGGPQWTRRRLLRVYPSASPAVALVTRVVDAKGHYDGFAQLDPRTGQTTAQLAASDAPAASWWLAFPSDLSTLGFLTRGRPGRSFDMRTAKAVTSSPQSWSFCTTTPAALHITGQQAFFPVAAMCPFDVATGKELDTSAAPPGWYTGAVGGWRIWRDQNGGLHGVHDATGSTPGMYG